MSREIHTFPISSRIRQKLVAVGFTSEADLKGITPLDLCKDTGLTQEESLQVIKTIKSSSVTILTESAHDLMQKELDESGIVTFSQKLDDMFGGGIPVGKITEFSGVPGVGKTQISMQLAVDVQIPQCFGGVEGEAIYIDTEGSFVAQRVAQIATATAQHCEMVMKTVGEADMTSAMQSLTTENILKGIHYFRCKSCVELIALSYQLKDFIKQRKKIKLIVVDSLAFPFRHNWDDMAQRTRLLNHLAQIYIQLATQFSLAVVLVNQMTTRVVGHQGKVVPALGESWSHVPTNRVLLFWQGGTRYANLFKSPNRKEDTVPYIVTAEGIRDISVEQLTQNSGASSQAPQVKRPRNDT